MLTYTPPRPPEAERPTEKPWLLLLLCFVWLWPGILGHDPWRPNEPYVVGIVQSMLETGNWSVPSIVGMPYLETPPLYHWLAASLVSLLSPWLLSAHDAARIATPLLMSLALWCVGLAGRDLIGRRHGRSAVMILIGCLGLMTWGHELSPDVGLFTGFCLGFYALALGIRQGWLAGLWLGLASVLIMWCASLLELALIWMVALTLPAFRAWRGGEYLKTLLVAPVVALPLLLCWPLLLHKASPELFEQWWLQHALGPFNGFGRLDVLHEFGYYLKLFPWFTWPAWPLAAWAVWQRRHRLDEPVTQLSLLFFTVLLFLLTLSPRQTQALALPLLLPLVILAASELDSLRRGAASFLNWFGLMTFGLLGAFMWVGWGAMNFGWPTKLAERSHFFSPAYQPHVNWPFLILGIAASLTWLWAVTRRHVRGRQAVTNWAAGATLVWGLGMTLWLPWFDAQKSYRSTALAMQAAIPSDANCVATASTHYVQRALWYYFAGIRLLPTEQTAGAACQYRMVMHYRSDYQPSPSWEIIWQGNRPGSRREFYFLLKKQ